MSMWSGKEAKKRLVVLGAGTAGTMVVNKLRPPARPADWAITVVDRDDEHLLPAGLALAAVRSLRARRAGQAAIAVHPRGRREPRARGRSTESTPTRTACCLADGRELGYDYLVIATGAYSAPDQTPGMVDGRVAREHLRLLHPRRRDRAARQARVLGGRPAGRARRRDADQVPGRTAGVRLSRRRVLRRAGHAGPRRDQLRHPVGGRLHQAGRVTASRRHAGRAQDRDRGRLHGRPRRPGRQTLVSTTSGRSRSTCSSPCR